MMQKKAKRHTEGGFIGEANKQTKKRKNRGKDISLIIGLIIIGTAIVTSLAFPRLEGAQGSARDTARKSDIAQLGSAIISYYNNEGKYPGNNINSLVPAYNIQDELIRVTSLNSVPTDPMKNSSFDFNGVIISNSQYGYMLYEKGYGLGFVIMAKTETEGGSNFVYGGKSNANIMELCNTIHKGDRAENINGVCTYSSKDQLRYVYIF